MITVIADDITGAAEIAGIGFRYGLKIHFITQLEDKLPESDLLVYATDTRSLTCQEATDETRRVVRQLWKNDARTLFKKTDSALRGHLTEELRVLLEETGYRNVLLVPENPSRGRTIEEGIYYMHGKPIAETNFAFDPEFPAYTSSIAERFPGIKRIEEHPAPLTEGIFMADAQSTLDIALLLQRHHSPETLLAGAADLFATYLESLGYTPVECPAFTGLGARDALIVCGSTLSGSLEETPYCRRKALRTRRMPKEVFKGTAPAEQWEKALKKEFGRQRSLLLTIGHPSEGGKEFALRLRSTMASVVTGLVKSALPQELIIEGGATAFSILNQLNWQSFQLTEEIVPGIVRMKSEAGPYITLKPGSYQWGEVLFQ